MVQQENPTCQQKDRKSVGKDYTTYCPNNLPPTSQVTRKFTGFQHKKTGYVNCETENCIYYLMDSIEKLIAKIFQDVNMLV